MSSEARIDRSAAERDRLIAENNRLRQELRERCGLLNLVGNSRAMRLVCEQIGQIAHSSAHVLLRGEPGTGRALIARAIHHNSARSRRPFVRAGCAGVSESTLDAHLFGEGKGTSGYVQRAHGGTLFLDEVNSLSVPAQDRLLALIRDRVVERPAGGTIRSDVRLIAATSANLDESVSDGSFRHEFHSRLSMFTITVPPLRERKADLPTLIDLFVERFAREHVRRVVGLSPRAMDMLMSYDWPGNVRELSAVIERTVVIAPGPIIHHQVLPAAIQEAARFGAVAPVGLTEALDAYERELLRDALRQTRGVRSKAARLLRTTERIFNYKLRKHGIDSRQFKVTE